MTRCCNTGGLRAGQSHPDTQEIRNSPLAESDLCAMPSTSRALNPYCPHLDGWEAWFPTALGCVKLRELVKSANRRSSRGSGTRIECYISLLFIFPQLIIRRKLISSRHQRISVKEFCHYASLLSSRESNVNRTTFFCVCGRGGRSQSA